MRCRIGTVLLAGANAQSSGDWPQKSRPINLQIPDQDGTKFGGQVTSSGSEAARKLAS
jgi:hypothetical protein